MFSLSASRISEILNPIFYTQIQVWQNITNFPKVTTNKGFIIKDKLGFEKEFKIY